MELNGQCNGIIRLPEGFFVLSFRQPWCSLGVETCFRANHGLPNPVRQSIGKLKWNEAGYFKKIYMLYFVCVFLSFYFALSGRAATYFLCFAKESKQRKATPVAGLLRKLPSLHMLLAAGASRFAPDRPCFRQNHVPFGCAKGWAARIVRFRQLKQNNA